MGESPAGHPEDPWRQSRHSELGLWSNGNAADGPCEEEGWKDLHVFNSLPVQCELTMAFLGRTTAASALERHDPAVVESHDGERCGSPMALSTQTLEPDHFPISGFFKDPSADDLHERPQIRGAGLSIGFISPSANEASPDCTCPSNEATRSARVSHVLSRQARHGSETCTSEPLNGLTCSDHDDGTLWMASHSHMAKNNHLYSTEIVRNFDPSNATGAAAVHDTEENARNEKILDDSAIDTASASGMAWATVVTGELMFRHPSLHGFQLPPAFPPRRRGFDPGELEGAMAAAFGWG